MPTIPKGWKLLSVGEITKADEHYCTRRWLGHSDIEHWEPVMGISNKPVKEDGTCVGYLVIKKDDSPPEEKEWIDPWD